jgi:molybdopterin-binding protein
MQLSARNQLKGRVTDVKKGPVSTEVTIDINGQIVVSSITTGSAETLNLEIGNEVTTVIKASNVMIAK